MRNEVALGRVFVLALSLLALLGCASAFLPTQFRSVYRIQKIDELMASNLDYFQKVSATSRINGLVDEYVFVVQNTAKKTVYEVLGKEASLRHGQKAISASCRSGVGENISIDPGASARIVCSLLFDDRARQVFGGEDANLELSIPVRGGSKKAELTFLYRIKKEDFP